MIPSSDVGRSPSAAGGEDSGGGAYSGWKSAIGVIFVAVEANRGARGPARHRSDHWRYCHCACGRERECLGVCEMGAALAKFEESCMRNISHVKQTGIQKILHCG